MGRRFTRMRFYSQIEQEFYTWGLDKGINVDVRPAIEYIYNGGYIEYGVHHGHEVQSLKSYGVHHGYGVRHIIFVTQSYKMMMIDEGEYC